MLDRIKGYGSVLGGLGTAMAVGMLMLASGASATPADPIETAFGDVEAKVAVYGGLLVGVVIAAVLILFGIKWINKARSAA